MADEAPPPGEEQNPVASHLRRRLASLQQEAAERQRAANDGTADPRILQALHIASQALQEQPKEHQAELQIETIDFVFSRFAQAEAAGEPFDPAAVAGEAAADARRKIEGYNRGLKSLRSLGTSVGSLRLGVRTVDAHAERVQSELETARAPNFQPVPLVPDLSGSRLERQNQHIIRALEQMNADTASQAKWMILSAKAAVGAVVVGVLALIVAVLAIILA